MKNATHWSMGEVNKTALGEGQVASQECRAQNCKTTTIDNSLASQSLVCFNPDQLFINPADKRSIHNRREDRERKVDRKEQQKLPLDEMSQWRFCLQPGRFWTIDHNHRIITIQSHVVDMRISLVGHSPRGAVHRDDGRRPGNAGSAHTSQLQPLRRQFPFLQVLVSAASLFHGDKQL